MEARKAEKRVNAVALVIPEGLIGLGEAAELMGVERQTIHVYASRGILPVALRIGKIRYYRKCDVLELKEKRGKGFAKGRAMKIENKVPMGLGR
jgi:hypothetical protein